MNQHVQLKPDDDHTSSCLDKQRLDKYIWFARFLRNRAGAAELIAAGHVRVNGRRVIAPGHFVRRGDVLTLALPSHTILIRIIAFAAKRGDSNAAKKLYDAADPAQDKNIPALSMPHQANN